MSDVTRILEAVDRGDPQAAATLLPLVYQELRRLAAHHLADEKPGQTLQPTALVHEAYLRLVGPANAGGFAGRRHFFAAAAEAIRRILIEQSRRKRAEKRGGGRARINLEDLAPAAVHATTDLLDLNDALDKLASLEPRKAELVKLRYFAGMTLREAAETLDIAESTADDDWAYARAWLRLELGEPEVAV